MPFGENMSGAEAHDVGAYETKRPPDADEDLEALIRILRPDEMVGLMRDHFAKHVQQMEDLADRFAEQWELRHQFRVMDDLVRLAMYCDDALGRLPIYFKVLDKLALRLTRWGKKQPTKRERLMWADLEYKVIGLLLDVQYNLNPDLKERREAAIRGQQLRAQAKRKAKRDAEREAKDASLPPPPLNAPPPKKIPKKDWSKVPDAELEKWVPEEER